MTQCSAGSSLCLGVSIVGVSPWRRETSNLQVLADAIKSCRLSRAEAVEAAIARTEAVNPALNGLACQAFDQAREVSGGRRGMGSTP
jgi:Asp-tRNA(Asn)/Glu-tRNA(Gln) amidotransferase A subunit family amidase